MIGLGLKGCQPSRAEVLSPIPSTENGFLPGESAPLGEYIHLKPDGTILINVVRLEMGQGATQGIMAIFVEELDADWEKVSMVYSDPIPGLENWTGGSTTTFREWDTMRNAGAAIRKLLVETAAQEWGVEEAECRVEKGSIFHQKSQRELNFGALAEKVVFRDIGPEELQLKDPSNYKLIGTPFQNRVIPDIVLGAHPYGMDFKQEGLLYASIERAPTIDATLLSFDDSECLKVSGVRKVVQINGVKVDGNTHVRTGIAVVATNSWAAMEGRKRLKVNWQRGPKAEIKPMDYVQEAHNRLETEKKNKIFEKGDIQAFDQSEWQFSQTYEFPYQHHACMEVLNATARIANDGCEVWQASERAQKQIAKWMDLSPDKVKVHCHPAGGGFGLRYWAAPELEAAMVSKAAGGDLVQVLYTREDDIQFDYLNPLEINKHSVGINGDKVNSWKMETAIDSWGGTCAWMIYDIPNLYAGEIRLDGFTQMSAWRAVMGNAEGFSTECFIDELAFEMNQDPLDFRRSLLTKGKKMKLNHQFEVDIDRILSALNLVAEKADWGKEMPAGSGQGIAVYPYMHGNGYAAVVAEVSSKDGTLKVEKVTLAVECGLVVNPDFVKKQMEGGIIWALSAIFYGGTDYENGSVTRSNFHDNQLLRLNETPEIEIHVCQSKEPSPWGVGEIAPPVTYPAVMNAIFAATNKRIRKLPISKQFT